MTNYNWIRYDESTEHWIKSEPVDVIYDFKRGIDIADLAGNYYLITKDRYQSLAFQYHMHEGGYRWNSELLTDSELMIDDDTDTIYGISHIRPKIISRWQDTFDNNREIRKFEDFFTLKHSHRGYSMKKFGI